MLLAIRNLYKDNALVLAVVITVSVAVLSLFNLNNFKPTLQMSHIDKYEHLTAYFILTLSWLLAIQKSEKLIKHRFILAGFVFLYGILMEILQHVLTDYRQADLYDVFANTSGIIIGILFFEKVISSQFKEFLCCSD